MRDRFLILLAFVLFLLAASPVLALSSLSSNMELDGNILKDSPPSSSLPADWGGTASNPGLFSGTVDGGVNSHSGGGGASNPLPPGALASVFIHDEFATGLPGVGSLDDRTVFITGGSKDINDVTAWKCTAKSEETAKDNILHAYAVFFRPTTGDRAGHLILYGALEKYSNAGDNNAGFWLFQNPGVSCVGTGPNIDFSGSHTVGDLLITAKFETGGTVETFSVYEWVGIGGEIGGGTLHQISTGVGVDCGSSPTADACGRVNGANIPTPWADKDKELGLDKTLAPREFFEFGVDITVLMPTFDSCFAGFLAGTRSSPSPTAELKDYALGSLNSCPGHIIVDKVTDPRHDPTSFTFTPSYGSSFSLKDDDSPNDSGPLVPGAYSVSETVPPGWDLTSATCDDGSSPSSIGLAAGETVKCTFTDTKRGHIIVEKQTIGGDSTKFSFTGKPAGQISNGEQLKVENLVPGTYTSTETVPYGWKLTDITCNDTSSANPSSGDKDTGVATFNLDAGEVVKCTFTNEKSAGAFAGIIVEKQTIPDGDPATFTFSGDAAGVISDNQQIVVVDLIPGTYYSTETVPSGWKLTSISCDDSNSVGDLDAKKATFNLEAGETVKCTFTNMDPSKLGTIVVEKQTIPGGDPQLFTFTGTAADTIGDGGQIVVGNLVPGTYTSTETVPDEWKLTDITCNDANSSGDLGTKTATFKLDAGETVKCTFTDEKPSGPPLRAPVGGELYSVDKSALVRPYVVSLLGLLAAVATAVAITRRHRH
jgi:hypothetical protein